MIPKFRVWDKKRKRIVEVVAINFYLEQVVTKDITIPFDYVELMQSTGLKDKNGNEIFEGDIVENTTQIVYMGDKFEVTWNKNYACYQLMNNGLASNIPLIQDFMSYEVIGNIYENPELLEVEE